MHERNELVQPDLLFRQGQNKRQPSLLIGYSHVTIHTIENNNHQKCRPHLSHSLHREKL